MSFSLTCSKRVLVTGASGFLGSFLVSFLPKEGYFVEPLKRESYILAGDLLSKESLEGCYAVIHLAGESLSRGFWTKKKREEILKSRVEGTQKLTKLLSQLKNPPKVFISASAVGYYGDREEALTEESEAGSDFLSCVCQKWEQAAASNCLEEKGVRVVFARFGYILSCKGGMLKALRLVFRFGLGGRIGSGLQFMPWIALEDVGRSLCHILETPVLKGPVNIVSPNPVTQIVFAKTLSSLLKRPCFFGIPKWALLGKKAKALMLPSLKVFPLKLEETGFTFQFSSLKEALRFNLFT